MLKMTEKVGVSSTRHHNPDFIAKLENQDPQRMKQNDNTFTYKKQLVAGDNLNIHGQHELNSPKY
jgi:hypothetical protein